jgi:phosphoglycolate phosphatase-like HAD superfamily hydrolase
MTRAARRLFGPTFSLEQVDRNGRLDPEIIATALELNGVQATEDQLCTFRDWYIDELRREGEATRPLPGVRQLLAELRVTDGVLLGSVSGNYAEAARIKLQAAGLDPDWFVANGFGGQADTRRRLVRLAMDRAAGLLARPIPGRHVIVIGDTPRDVDSAKANDCTSLAVATGNYSVEQLAAAGADAVLADLAKPAPLWAMLEKA